jgi:hypothetical protein
MLTSWEDREVTVVRLAVVAGEDRLVRSLEGLVEVLNRNAEYRTALKRRVRQRAVVPFSVPF